MKETFIAGATETQRILRNYSEQLDANKLNNLEEWINS